MPRLLFFFFFLHFFFSRGLNSSRWPAFSGFGCSLLGNSCVVPRFWWKKFGTWHQPCLEIQLCLAALYGIKNDFHNNEVLGQRREALKKATRWGIWSEELPARLEAV